MNIGRYISPFLQFPIHRPHWWYSHCCYPKETNTGTNWTWDFHQHTKTILNHLHKYRITCSYDEVLRLKKSAGNSSKGGYINGVPKDNTLFQVISDNIDTDLSSQNGKS